MPWQTVRARCPPELAPFDRLPAQSALGPRDGAAGAAHFVRIVLQEHGMLSNHVQPRHRDALDGGVWREQDAIARFTQGEVLPRAQRHVPSPNILVSSSRCSALSRKYFSTTSAS